MGNVLDPFARTAQPANATQAPAAATGGFRGQLDGASLWDVVQIECLNRRREILRVIAGSEFGHLFLADGRVVHASTQLLEGERAAMTILGWEQGSFERCELAWPERETITAPIEHLMLEAARMRDEEAARGDGPGAQATVFPPRETQAASGMRTDGRRGTRVREGDVTAEIRLGPSGAVLEARGAAEDLPPRVAYASRMAQIVGELLELREFMALEASVGDGHLIVRVEEGGGISAVKLLPGADASHGQRG